MSPETDPSTSPSQSNETFSERSGQPPTSPSTSTQHFPAFVPPLAESSTVSTNEPPTTNSVPMPSASSPASTPSEPSRPVASWQTEQPPGVLLLAVALVLMAIGLVLNVEWLGWTGCVVALLLSARIIWGLFKPLIVEVISPEQVTLIFALVGGFAALVGLFLLTEANERVPSWISISGWDEIGAIGDVVGALGQILIAVLAVYIAWRQYVISKDLTIQQNLITQQQTIDSYFQGISDLVLDAEGLLEDWPQERAIAEGRTAAILSSVDPTGKAKIVRFLSRSRLLTPLKRDRHLGRAMLDGMGGYQEDRDFGIRVIDLGVMLAASNLAETDMRWTDLSDTNLVRANLAGCDLVKSNLGRTILYEANLRGADLMGTKLFYGTIETATPRTRTEVPNYNTGTCTGAVVENADFTGVQRLSGEQRQYICQWGGQKTRSTVPEGCGDIPNKLGR